jgi:N-acetylmuramic acid 6-phosphate etherase
MALINYARLSTEQVHSGSRNLDRLSSARIVRLMNREDRKVLRAIAQAAPEIARAIEVISAALRTGGRLFLAGAGTSGRLGVLEAAECPPTFNTPPALIQAIMAGGKASVFRSQEGAEDSRAQALSACRRAGLTRRDVVVGIAASGVTAFVQTILRRAKGQKAHTIFLTCNPRAPRDLAQVTIALPTGPEVLSGSTRLKAGTACKMVLNMLTTGSMVRLGKVYGNRMVDLQPRSRKLVARGIRLIGDLGRVREKDARRLLKAAHGNVKIAILMARRNIPYAQASSELRQAGGFLRKVL